MNEDLSTSLFHRWSELNQRGLREPFVLAQWQSDVASCPHADQARLLRRIVAASVAGEASMESVAWLLNSLATAWGLDGTDHGDALVWDLATEDSAARLADLYRAGPASDFPRHLLLTLLAQAGTEASLTQFATLLVDDPPHSVEGMIEAISPIFRGKNLPWQAIFPRLLDALQHPVVATGVLDLATFLVRSGRVAEHPARPRETQLVGLLGHLIERLELDEQTFREQGIEALPRARTVGESIALAVAVTAALSLMKSTAAIGKLYRMLELSHRRLRLEAAVALTRLGDDTGRDALVEMAADRNARLRVLAAAEELRLVEQIAPEFRDPLAIAEAQLAATLSEFDYFGIAPTTVDLLEQRLLRWPGEDEPIDVFLFTYGYVLPNLVFEGVGFAGPVAHCFKADLSHLPHDDQFAAFAGWQAEHEEIREVEIDPHNQVHQTQVHRYLRRLQDLGMTAIEPLFLADFLGIRLLVANASCEGSPGTAVVDPVDVAWFERGDPRRPVDAETAYCIYKGRRILRTFNPEFGSPDTDD